MVIAVDVTVIERSIRITMAKMDTLTLTEDNHERPISLPSQSQIMNTIATFRKCDITNDELLKRVDRLTDQMYKGYGKIPDRQIPARPNDDYDLLVGELILRFEELKAELSQVREENEQMKKMILSTLTLTGDESGQNR